MTKLNCWEYHNCKVGMNSSLSEDELCEVARAKECNEINNGINGGRICWSVSGTLCNNKHKGHFTHEIDSCMQCNFFKVVQSEEKKNFVIIRPIHKF